MKKICFISLEAYALFKEKPNHFGGSEVQLFQLSKKLATYKEFEIYFFVHDIGRKSERKYNIKIIPIYALCRRFGVLSGIKANINLFLACKKIKADVYITRAAGITPFIIAAYCKLFKKRFVYMVAHEIDVSGEFVKKGFVGRLFRWALLNSSLVITQSQEQRKMLKRNFGKTSVILNSAYEISKKKFNKKAKKYILWVGRQETWKHPELFLELCKYFPKEKFLFIGTDPMKYISKLPKNLIHINRVSFNKIDSYFRKAKIFVNTSDYEGFPNTFVQAAKNSVPILSIKVDPDSILSRFKMGYRTETFLGLKNAISNLLSNKKLYSKMSENARQYAKQNHDLHKIGKKLKSLLTNLI